MDLLNVLIIPDKFKGTLTARAAAEAIARGWRRARPADWLELLPMSDGGDGFGQVMNGLLGGKRLSCRTVDAAQRSCLTNWWWEPRSETALIESAAAIGLAMLPPNQFHPFELDTRGLGNLVRAAAERGARRCLVGIGGSATNDGGFGLARALGWHFLSRAGQRIEQWTDLPELEHILPPRRRRWFRDLVVAVDVQNPLLGQRGATRVYGPQKGLRRHDFKFAEHCLHRLARVASQAMGRDFAHIPGAGAAGGLGFGFLAFLGARLEPGFELFADLAGLDRRLRSTNLVVTAEGAMDASTLMGKGVGRVAQRCKQLGVACIGLAGRVEPGARKPGIFARLRSLTELATFEEAKAQPALWLQRLAEKTARQVKLQAPTTRKTSRIKLQARAPGDPFEV